MKICYQFLVLLFATIIFSTASADRFLQKKHEVIIAINNSYNNATKIINQFNNLIQKQRHAQQKINKLRPLMVADNTSYCYKSLLQATQKNIKLMSSNKQQLIRKKLLLINLRKLVYQSYDIFQLNKNIESLNRYTQQTNLLIERTNELDRLWVKGVKNSCSVYLK